MIEFAYNNKKNTNISHIFFELNYRYYPYYFYKKDFDYYSKSKIVKKLSFKL